MCYKRIRLFLQTLQALIKKRIVFGASTGKMKEKGKHNEWHWRSQCVHPRQEEDGTGSTWFCLSNNIVCSFHAGFVCLFVNLVVCPKQVRGENALWARESRSRFAICASTPTRKLSNGDRLNCFFFFSFWCLESIQIMNIRVFFFNCSAQISVLKRKTLLTYLIFVTNATNIFV